MRAAEARALLFQRKLQELLVDFSIPGLTELDNQLSVLELRANEVSHCNKLAEDKNGKPDPILVQAAAVCKALVMRDTKERVFSDTDFEGVAGFGLTVLKPIGDLVTKVSGLEENAIEIAKKNSPTTQDQSLNTSSTENSAQPVLV